jgi:hypothetical protein
MGIELTAEQSAAVAAAAGPVAVTDPATGRAYRLVAEEAAGGEPAPPDGPPIQIPEGIVRARAALRRDLPALLASWWTRGKWACYTGDGRVKVGRDYSAVIREAVRRGIPRGEYVVERIEPGAGSDEVVEIEVRE